MASSRPMRERKSLRSQDRGGADRQWEIHNESIRRRARMSWNPMAAATDTEETSSVVPLRRTPLHALQVALGARMVPFAGYDMPVQYPTGILAEHAHTRSHAGLFDVSHMGQAFLLAGRHAAAAQALEALCAADVLGVL